VRSLDWDILDSLKTTIDIPAEELADAMRFTGAKTKREAVARVIQEFNQHRRMAALVKFSGTFSDKFPTNEAIEAVDMKRDQEWQH
jgi:Ca2+-binding EF-hand superfamily protein